MWDMRKIIVISMITIDGVMQAPGGPEEDRSGGFKYGGWVAPYGDEVYGKVMEKQMKPANLLLGKKHLRFLPATGQNMKMDGRVLMMSQNTSCPRIRKNQIGKIQFSSKAWGISKSSKTCLPRQGSKGSDIKVWGSGELVKSLLKNDLVDELRLKIHPITLGKRKKLFDNRSVPAALSLIESTVTTTGVIIANYKRAGKVKTGTIGT